MRCGPATAIRTAVQETDKPRNTNRQPFNHSSGDAQMKRSVILATATLAVSLFALPMFATTTVSSVGTNNVTATVVGSCKWSTPLTMAFGNYDPFAGAATTQSTSVNFRCVKQTNGTDTY